ncbi:hypothetical protein QQP08_000848 [Theobroma cacao]|nr:hypothetical protein QQP08_000848 [Theobroma cacao]
MDYPYLGSMVAEGFDLGYYFGVQFLPLSLLVGWHLKKNLFAMELCVLTKKVFLAGVGVLLSNEGLVKLRNVPPLLDRVEWIHVQGSEESWCAWLLLWDAMGV